jgi:hypothetical protein
MPDERIETRELQEKLDQALEQAEEAGEERASPRWTLHLSLSTAIVAVIAAIASLHAGILANQVILHKNEAVLSQAKASDTWAYYQAKGIKGLFYQVQSESAPARGSQAQKFAAEAKRYKGEQDELKTQAEEMEKKVDENNKATEHLLHRHEQFAMAVTFFQVSIALSAIASLTRRKTLWYVGMAIASVGVVFFFRGWLV